MAFSHIDFAIASGIFLVFLGIIFSYTVNYLANYRNIAESSELRGIALNLFNTFFTSKGVPSDWDERGYTPAKIGLMNSLYRIALNVTETNGTARSMSVNGTINFDENCERKILNNTVRLYSAENQEIAFQLYNQTFCESKYLKKGEIVFNLSLEAYQNKIFFVYFSPEKNVSKAGYSIPFPDERNYTFQTFPVEELQTISVDRLKALRGLLYEGLIQGLVSGYNFRVEVSA